MKRKPIARDLGYFITIIQENRSLQTEVICSECIEQQDFEDPEILGPPQEEKKVEEITSFMLNDLPDPLECYRCEKIIHSKK